LDVARFVMDAVVVEEQSVCAVAKAYGISKSCVAEQVSRCCDKLGDASGRGLAWAYNPWAFETARL
jgi:hypothetical protein